MNNTPRGMGRENILRSAAVLFPERGYAGTTIKDLAQHAAVNENTIFRHFKTKQNLFSEVLNETVHFENLIKEIDLALSDSDDTDAIRRGLQIYSEALVCPGVARLIIFTSLEGQLSAEVNEAAEGIHTYTVMISRAFAGRYKLGVERGTFRDIQPIAACQLLLDAIVGHVIIYGIIGAGARPSLRVDNYPQAYFDSWLRTVKKQ